MKIEPLHVRELVLSGFTGTLFVFRWWNLCESDMPGILIYINTNIYDIVVLKYTFSFLEGRCYNQDYFMLLPTGDTFEGGEVEAYTMDEGVDYPRDPITTEITASVHSQLQVQ